MKARDIIPGWPIGRSTIPAYDGREFTLLFEARNWPMGDFIRLADELVQDGLYHQEQERMTQEWRTKTGQFELKAIHFPVVGYKAEP